MFAEKMIMQHPDTKEVIAEFRKANGLMRVEPAEKTPVFCMFAVYEEDCKVDEHGNTIINLSSNGKRRLENIFRMPMLLQLSLIQRHLLKILVKA